MHYIIPCVKRFCLTSLWCIICPLSAAKKDVVDGYRQYLATSFNGKHFRKWSEIAAKLKRNHYDKCKSLGFSFFIITAYMFKQIQTYNYIYYMVRVHRLKKWLGKAMMQYLCVLHPDYFTIAFPKSNFHNKLI